LWLSQNIRTLRNKCDTRVTKRTIVFPYPISQLQNFVGLGLEKLLEECANLDVFTSLGILYLLTSQEIVSQPVRVDFDFFNESQKSLAVEILELCSYWLKNPRLL
jgi:hypothetical protein